MTMIEKPKKSNFTVRHKKELIAAHGNKCIKCGESDPSKIQWHHVLPKSLGGEDSIENIVPLCVKCHALEHGHGCYVDTKKGGRPKNKQMDFGLYLAYIFYLTDIETKILLGWDRGTSTHIQDSIPQDFKEMLFRKYGIVSYMRKYLPKAMRNGSFIDRYYTRLWLSNGTTLDVPSKGYDWKAMLMFFEAISDGNGELLYKGSFTCGGWKPKRFRKSKKTHCEVKCG